MIDSVVKFKYNNLHKVKTNIKSSFEQNGFIHVEDVFSISLCNEAKSVLLDYEKQFLYNKNEVGIVTEKIGDEIKIKYFQ